MFQSTHPCGVRPAAAIVYAVLEQTFQSTHPCGVRLSAVAGTSRAIGFQSTHPCGVRHIRF